MTREVDYDVIIVGGGLVGASLACALVDQPLRVAVIEATALRSGAQPSFDARTVALSYSSRRIFDAMRLWAVGIAPSASPIERIVVCDRGHLGALRLDCREHGTDALGYVVENRVLGEALLERVSNAHNVNYLCPASVTGFSRQTDTTTVQLVLEGEPKQLTTRLVVAADGGNSAVRKLAGVKAWQVGYGQTAIIANVLTDAGEPGVAFEKFTNSGPLALLPMIGPEQECGQRYALVWTVRDSQRDEILSLEDEAFLARLQQRFGQRCGRFVAVGQRFGYPLTLLRMHQQVRSGLVFVGNAAHTLHPVAGQGFNLGLRDVAALAQTLVEARTGGEDIGALRVLKRYAAWRRTDHLQVTAFTDGVVRLFSTDNLPFAVARNAGLLALDLVPPLKRAFARQAMGVMGRLPRLARGLPL
ncbi:MAG: hypothetical protein AMJ69_12810 [Gammaproteobacteria bacterium SG8_47]|nr:MAG: hypothetical protein AMJ69_12810 [Gammaproteobacteria bacterium SG8_47]